MTTHDPISLMDYIKTLLLIYNKEIDLVSIKKEILISNKIRPIIDIPLWSNGSHFIFSNEKLNKDINIKYISLLQSLLETFHWNNSISKWKEGKSKWEEGKWGLSREKELSLLNKYK